MEIHPEDVVLGPERNFLTAISLLLLIFLPILKDMRNMVGGASTIVTLSHKDNRVGGGRDEQFHCLPLYKIKANQD